MSQCARERKSLPVFSESPVLHPADCLSRDWGYCPPSPQAEGPGGTVLACARLPVTQLGWSPPLSAAEILRAAVAPAARSPPSALPWSVDRTCHHVEAQRLQEATGQVGEPPSWSSAQRPGLGACYIPTGTTRTISGRLILHSIRFPGKRSQEELCCSELCAGPRGRREGLGRGRQGSGRGSTHVPPGRGRGRRQGSVSTIAFLLTMGSNFTFPSITCTVFS